MNMFYRARHAEVPPHRLRRRSRIVVPIAVALSLFAAVNVASADQIVNNIDNTIDDVLETRTITAGASTVVGFYVEKNDTAPAGDVNGCNAGSAEKATMTLSVPLNVTALGNPVIFAGCGSSSAVNVTFSSNTPGTYQITVHSVTGGKEGSRWATGPAAFTLQVNPAPPAKAAGLVSIDNIPSPSVYGDSFTPNLVAAGAGAKSVSSSTTAVCTVASGVVTFVGTGECTLQAAVAESATHLAATRDYTFAVVPKSVTGSFTAANKPYDGTADATVLTRSLSGLVGMDDVSLSGGTASFDSASVGAGKAVTLTGATLAGAAAGNYTLGSVDPTTADITPKSVTGSFTAANKVYDGTADATVLTRSLSGVVGMDDVSLSGGTASFNSAAVGTGKTVTLTDATLAGADAGNYTLAFVNTTTADITAWGATGFHSPVGAANSVFGAAPGGTPAANAGTVWNTAKGGSAIPLKFNVWAGDTEMTDAAMVRFSVVRLSCPSAPATDPVELDPATTSTGGTSLRYDSSGGHFIQNWATPKVSANTCFRAMVTFADGSMLAAFFQLRK